MKKILLAITLLFSSLVISAPKDSINLGDYVTDFTGTTDQTTQVQLAEAEAFRLKLPLFHPGGTILTGHILFRVALFANPGYRSGMATFKSTVDDGTPSYETTSLSIDNIWFRGSHPTNTNPNNSTGLVAGNGPYPLATSTSVGSLIKGHISNVTITNFAVGFKGFGWINRVDNLFVNFCTLGALFDTFNASVVDYSGESNRQDFILFHSVSVHFTRLMIEGAVGDTPSLIDNSIGIQIDGLYAEQIKRTVPWITINRSKFIDFTAGYYYGCGVGCEPIQQINSSNVIISAFKAS
jgi:hypothetical protein